MVINVRGTSGSGKTTVMRYIMEKAVRIEKFGPEKKPDGYQLVLGSGRALYLVGSYENVCGGCDAIPTQDEICNRVRHWAHEGDVLLEGLLMSHVFSRYAALAMELQRQDVPSIFGFLDTPLDVCLERVNARRAARGVTEPVNPENTSDKWHANRSTFDKFVKPASKNWKDVNKFLKTWGQEQVEFPYPKLDARWIDHRTAGETVLGWLQ
jgi:thymidylate kinase